MENIWPKISKEEILGRVEAFREKMRGAELDLVVMYSNMLDPSAVRYFSDFYGVNESAGMVIPLEGEAILCSGQASHEWSAFKSAIRDIRIMPEVGEVSGVEYDLKGQIGFSDLFAELAGKYSVKKIGIVGEYIFPQLIYGKLIEAFPTAEIVSADDLMYELRINKSPDEIACVRKACDIITETVGYSVDKIHAGMTELEIQADLEYKMLCLGAEGYVQSFSPMVPSGPVNSHLCMNRNSRRQVQESEMIGIAAGSCYEGYNGVICTPVVLGAVPEEIKKAVNTAFEAMRLVEEQLKPGITSIELYEIYIKYLKKTGYSEYCPYGSVHSLGLLECESPFFSANKPVVMKENMTIATDVYFKGLPWGSFRVEDTFLITKNGSERLTHHNDKVIPVMFK